MANESCFASMDEETADVLRMMRLLPAYAHLRGDGTASALTRAAVVLKQTALFESSTA